MGFDTFLLVVWGNFWFFPPFKVEFSNLTFVGMVSFVPFTGRVIILSSKCSVLFETSRGFGNFSIRAVHEMVNTIGKIAINSRLGFIG